MKVYVKMLKDYYYEGGKHEVWWKGDTMIIDEVEHQVSVDYLESEGYIEIIEEVREEEMVTISKSEYEILLKDSEFLNCLEACGVDNWDGYGDAMEMFEESEEE